MRRAKRSLFTERENRIICDLVKQIGEDWDVIAKKLPGRTPKQIHDRYINYLRQGLQNGPWTNEEDEILMKMYKMIGPKWSKMMKHLPGRSGNNIKNRWHKHIMKKYFGIGKQKMKLSSEDIDADNHKTQKSSNQINSQRNSFNTESNNLSMSDFSRISFENIFSSFDNSIGKQINSNNKIQMPSKDQIKHELQNFDFEKSFYNDFQQINDIKNNNIRDDQNKSAHNDTNHINLIQNVDIDYQSKNDFQESDKLSNQNSFLFKTSIELQELMEKLCFEKFGFL